MNPAPGLALFGIAIPGTLCLVLLSVFVVAVFIYLVTLSRILGHISPEHREMEPSKVWLLIIPVFGLIWHFFVVFKLSHSIKKAFEAQDLNSNDPHFSIGLGLVVSTCLCFVCISFIFPHLLTVILGAVFVVLWIIWWIKVAGYSRKLSA